MVPLHFLLLFGLIESNIPPLSPQAIERLELTVDGRDAKGVGFRVLVDHAEQWRMHSSEGQISVDPWDLKSLLADPSHFRGDLLTVHGTIEQQSILPAPWNHVQECFLRDAKGIPFILYVVGDFQQSNRSNIMAQARFYKTIDLKGRDDIVRSFVSFVTSSKVVTTKNNSFAIPIPLLLLPVVGIGAFIVFILSRRSPKRKLLVHNLSSFTDDVIDAASHVATDLPDDPAEALASLHKSAEGTQ